MEVPFRTHIEYPELTMAQMVERMAKKYPNEPAYEFYGNKTSYAKFYEDIETTAKAFFAMGIRRDDRVTICMPNTPQAMDCFYALDRIGAVANMVHPQSAQEEISFYLNVSKSKAILTLDMFTEKVQASLADVNHPVTILVARMQDKLPIHLAAAYIAKAGRHYLKFPNTANQVLWKQFLKGAKGISLPANVFDPDHTAAILYSGGTSGVPKGICLTDANINATALQAREAIQQEFHNGLSILSCMPLFHGFGLGINIHTALIHGACCILMPTFNTKSYAHMLIKKHPNFIAGVPTIFDALLHTPELEHADLSFLKGMFCGGDSLTVELKKKIDTFLKEHGATIQVREGYGLTECVTASCLTPKDTYKEGSIGLPFPDTVYAIVTPDTDEVLPNGEEGEIILRGPSVMKGYLDNEEETNKTLRRLADGNIWLYTGDQGWMDDDGYVYFRQRIKRMIITNGYNVYPGQLENVMDGMKEVAYSCVIGVKDPRRMQRVRAYVVLNEGYEASDAMKEKIMKALEQKIARYALPKEIIFREELPKTLVGKVAFRVLEDEANKEGQEENPKG
ncbi:MAG: acyl--CoA ligase [Lachnospiraceae bacterium]|nr:acyl--CoA ligase [Lachnospiraceae bacterium]